MATEDIPKVKEASRIHYVRILGDGDIMKAMFSVKPYIVVTILSGLFFLVSCMQSQGGNWKEYYQDSRSTYYYDKDSIHYPQQKTIFGLSVPNKNIVNVWTRDVSKEDGKIGDAMIEQISCIERQYAGHRPPKGNDSAFDVDVFANEYFGLTKQISSKRKPIEPGSMYENLLEKVCR